MEPADLEALLKKKPIPYVLGPGKQIYIVDHHHLARALWSLKIPEAILGDQLADWSDKETKEFWRLMESHHYCWPIDAEGNRRPYAAIPTSIADLTDNIWRTLGRRLRGKAFEDLDTPYQEFMWGDYFRTFMSRRLIELGIRSRRRSGGEARAACPRRRTCQATGADVEPLTSAVQALRRASTNFRAKL